MAILTLYGWLDSTQKSRACWFPIILDESSNSSSGNPHEFGLNALLGIDYHDMFIPFMLKCGLLNTFKHNKTGEIIVVPSINNGHYNKSGYIWKDFLAEYKLDFIELAYRCTKSGKKIITSELAHLAAIITSLFLSSRDLTKKEEVRGLHSAVVLNRRNSLFH